MSPQQKGIGRILVRIASSLAALLLIITVIFYINKDQIAAYILSTVHDIQHGEVVFDDIQLTPFAHFPNISIRISNLRYYERFRSDLPSTASPIASISNVYVSLHVLKLLRNEIDVSRVTCEDGFIHIVFYEDSTFNIQNAIMPKTTAIDSTTLMAAAPRKVNLSLNNLYLRDVSIHYEDKITGDKSTIVANETSADFTYKLEKLDLELSADLHINNLQYNSRDLLKDSPLNLVLEASYDLSRDLIEIPNGSFKINGLTFQVAGKYKLDKPDFIDLMFDASDEDLFILRQVFEEDILEFNSGLLKEGDLFLRGSLKGHIGPEIPNLIVEFGANDLSIRIPGSNEAFQNLYLTGRFESGQDHDLSSAALKINRLEGDVPGGHVSGDLEITDFTRPSIKAHLKSRLDITGLDKIFKLTALQDLKGIVESDITIDVVVDLALDTLVSREGNLALNLDNVAFKLRELKHPIESISGSFRHINDSLIIDSVHLQSGPSDLLINGHIRNLAYYVFRKEKSIYADLIIQSKAINIRDIPAIRLGYGPFNETVRNLVTRITAETTVSQLLDAYHFVPGLYQVHHLSAAVDGFTNLDQVFGTILIADDSSSLQIESDALAVSTGLGRINLTDVSVQVRDSSNLLVDCKIETKNFRIATLIQSFEDPLTEDNIDPMEAFTASLNFSADFVHTPLRSARFKTYGNIMYRSDKMDTVSITDFNVDFKELTFYSPDTTSGRIVESLDGLVSIGHLKSTSLDESDFQGELRGGKGVMRINFSGKRNFFRGLQKAQLIADFNDSVPSYHLEYEIRNFKLEDLWAQYYEDEIMRGAMHFNIDLKTKGEELEELISNAKGSVLVEGSDITLYGFDLDEILRNYRKSQNFNLTDVGAFALVGPFGALVTKGHDFSKISKTSPDDTTAITRFFSLWELDSGKVGTSDVAFTTYQNLVAVKGSIDIGNNKIDLITVGVVDKKGCSLLDQSVTGSFANPQLGDVNAVGKLFGAFVNVYKLVAGKECEPFYTGSLKHPAATKD